MAERPVRRIRFSDYEWALLGLRAAQQNLPTSTWVRRKVVAEAKKELHREMAVHDASAQQS